MLGKEQLSQGVDKCGGEGGDGMQRRIPYFEVVHRRSYDHPPSAPRQNEASTLENMQSYESSGTTVYR